MLSDSAEATGSLKEKIKHQGELVFSKHRKHNSGIKAQDHYQLLIYKQFNC